MIELIFTVDYEIYGDGTGSVTRLVTEPGEELLSLFSSYKIPIVFFVEAAEFIAMERYGALFEKELSDVKDQIRRFSASGFEIGLHLHPQWFESSYKKGQGWLLDYASYNMCILPREKIEEFVKQGIAYLRAALNDSGFIPVSFRAGNWLLQPTTVVSEVLAHHGILVDSSVFKGGYQGKYGLDYRRALSNGYYWRFSKDVNIPDEKGPLIEIPIYTKMVPIWRMLSRKRLALSTRSKTKGANTPSKNSSSYLDKIKRIRDFMRFTYPLKLDFCRMTFHEFSKVFEEILREDEGTPNVLKPIVSIGHTKDLVSKDEIKRILDFISEKSIKCSTFSKIVSALANA